MKIILDVNFYIERRTSPSTGQFSWSFNDSKLFSRTFNTSKLFSRTFNTSKLFSKAFKKCKVLKMQALAWEDNVSLGKRPGKAFCYTGFIDQLKGCKRYQSIEDSESFMKEINLSFNPDDPMPPGIEDDDDDSERDILILKDFPRNYSLSLPKIESYHFDIPSFSRPPVKPPDGNTGILNIKMMGDISDQKVPIPNLTITRVLNKEKSPYLLPHWSLKIFQPSAECPMMINGKNTPILDVSLFHFYPP
nr:hypothetical protein [Tanacetum cinerariifolium]